MTPSCKSPFESDERICISYFGFFFFFFFSLSVSNPWYWSKGSDPVKTILFSQDPFIWRKLVWIEVSLTSPSYHGLPWATAEPNFLHFLVKLGKPFAPKQNVGSARRVTRSSSYPVQLKTWSRRDDQSTPERCCWLGWRGHLFFIYT